MRKTDEVNVEYDRRESPNRRSLVRFDHNRCDVDIDDSNGKSTTAVENLKRKEFCRSVIAGFLVASNASECKGSYVRVQATYVRSFMALATMPNCSLRHQPDATASTRRFDVDETSDASRKSNDDSQTCDVIAVFSSDCHCLKYDESEGSATSSEL